MTSSGPIHHSRFPAQQGQAAPLAVTTASSLAHFTRATWDRLWQSGQPRGEGSERPRPWWKGAQASRICGEMQSLYLKHSTRSHSSESARCQQQQECRRAAPLLGTSKETSLCALVKLQSSCWSST